MRIDNNGFFLLISIVSAVLAHPESSCGTTKIQCNDDELTRYGPDKELEELLNTVGAYDIHAAPGQEFGNATTVYAAIWVEAMSSFKVATMDYDIDLYLATAWYDQRLKHSARDPILITNAARANKLWHPDLYFENSKAAVFHTVTSPNFLILVYEIGKSKEQDNCSKLLRSRFSVTLFCHMDLTNFPMDTQTCPLYLQSYAYVREALDLEWFVKDNTTFPITYHAGIRLNDMEIVDQFPDKHNTCYPLFRNQGCWSVLNATFTMKRRILFHVFQTYLPTGMLVCISWLSFWLDIKAAPARVSLEITTLLTIVSVANGARQGLPQVSYMKAIDIWLTICTVFIYCALLEYIAVQKDVPTVTSSPEASARKTCVTCTNVFALQATKIDFYSRIMFPVAFFTFTLAYWTYYRS